MSSAALLDVEQFTAANDLSMGDHTLSVGSLQIPSALEGRLATFGSSGQITWNSDVRILDGDTLSTPKLAAFTSTGSVDFASNTVSNFRATDANIEGVTRFRLTNDVDVGPFNFRAATFQVSTRLV